MEDGRGYGTTTVLLTALKIGLCLNCFCALTDYFRNTTLAWPLMKHGIDLIRTLMITTVREICVFVSRSLRTFINSKSSWVGSRAKTFLQMSRSQVMISAVECQSSTAKWHDTRKIQTSPALQSDVRLHM
jgi:hypothetical protein